MRFSTDYLWIAIQNLDPELLRTRLAESIWNLHAQPPLYNLFLGGVLKLFPDHYGAAFYVVHLGLGLGLVFTLYALLVRLQLPRPVAAALAGVFSVTPAVLLYETWLFYDYPMLLVVTASALALHRFAERGTVARGAVFFSLLALMVLVRSIYQVVWIGLAAAFVLAWRVAPARVVLRAAAIPAALVLALTVKNLVVFGTPSTSSWLGMNLAKVTVFVLPDAERSELARRGDLSGLARVPPFSPPPSYAGVLDVERRGIAALDEQFKSGDRRYPNGNHVVYLEASPRYLDDSLWVLRHRPGAYARGVKLATQRYFWPADYSGPPARNKEKLERWEGFWFALQGSTARANRVGFVLLAVYAAALAYGLVMSVRALLARTAPSAETATIAFIWLTLAYTTAIAVLTDLGENWRSRFPLDAIALALVAAALQRAWLARRSRQQRMLWQ